MDKGVPDQAASDYGKHETVSTPGIVILVYGLLVLGSGIIGYTITGSLTSAIADGVFELAFLATGVEVLRSKPMGFLMVPILTLLLTTFFGYRFAASGEIIPSGLMAVLGIVAVILYFALRP